MVRILLAVLRIIVRVGSVTNSGRIMQKCLRTGVRLNIGDNPFQSGRTIVILCDFRSDWGSTCYGASFLTFIVFLIGSADIRGTVHIGKTLRYHILDVIVGCVGFSRGILSRVCGSGQQPVGIALFLVQIINILMILARIIGLFGAFADMRDFGCDEKAVAFKRVRSISALVDSVLIERRLCIRFTGIGVGRIAHILI